MLVDAPPFEQIAQELRARLAGRVFVAHNVRFDYGFIRREFALAGGEWRAPNLCTVRLSRALYPEMPRHNLDAVMERHGIHSINAIAPCPTRACCWSSGDGCAPNGPPDVLQQALDASALRATLPAALSPDLADDLPEQPGRLSLLRSGRAGRRHSSIYRQGEQPARAGAGSLSGRCPRRQVVAARGAGAARRPGPQTAGELGALLLEAREIRESQPVYNRQLRGNGRTLHLAVWRLGRSAQPGRAGCRRGARRECLRQLAYAWRCAACARKPGTRTPLVLQVVRPGAGPRFLLRPPGRPLRRSLRRARGRPVAPGAREDGFDSHAPRSPGRIPDPWWCAKPASIASTCISSMAGSISPRCRATNAMFRWRSSRVPRRTRHRRFEIDEYRILTRMLRDTRLRTLGTGDV